MASKITYGEAVQEVVSIIEDTSQAANTDARNMIVHANRRIWRHAFWPDLQETYDFDSVSGQQQYPFATIGATLGKIKDVLWLPQNITNDFEFVDPERDFNKMLRKDKSVTGDPLIWSQWKKTLYLWPVPNYSGTDKLRVLGKKTVDDPADDEDTPFFPAEFSELWVNGAAWMFFDKDDDTRAQLYERYFKKMLLDMENELISEEDEGEYQVQFSDGSL